MATLSKIKFGDGLKEWDGYIFFENANAEETIRYENDTVQQSSIQRIARWAEIGPWTESSAEVDAPTAVGSCGTDDPIPIYEAHGELQSDTILARNMVFYVGKREALNSTVTSTGTVPDGNANDGHVFLVAVPPGLSSELLTNFCQHEYVRHIREVYIASRSTGDCAVEATELCLIRLGDPNPPL